MAMQLNPSKMDSLVESRSTKSAVHIYEFKIRRKLTSWCLPNFCGILELDTSMSPSG